MPAFVTLPLSASIVFGVTVLSGHGHVVIALALLSVVVFANGWASALPAALAVAGVSWLCLTGFVVDRQGVLDFHGGADAARLLVLVGAVFAGWLLRAAAATAAARRRQKDPPYPEIPSQFSSSSDEAGPPFHVQ